ncbi:hypothetical protein HK405_008802 [Cladochytrium tenue]|nr:hypothetical protein HK405_008802 [Cladochytrium tenue]
MLAELNGAAASAATTADFSPSAFAMDTAEDEEERMVREQELLMQRELEELLGSQDSNGMGTNGKETFCMACLHGVLLNDSPYSIRCSRCPLALRFEIPMQVSAFFDGIASICSNHSAVCTGRPAFYFSDETLFCICSGCDAIQSVTDWFRTPV